MFSLNLSPWINIHEVLPSVVHNMLTLCFASSTSKVAVFITTCTEYLRGWKVGFEEIKLWPVHCTRYRTEACRRQRLYVEMFSMKFSLRHFPRADFHIFMLKVVDNMLSSCFTSTAMTIPEFLAAYTEYRTGRTVDLSRENLFTVSNTLW